MTWRLDVLVIARSRSSVSESGDSSHSFKLAPGYSLPITDVTSNDTNWSSTPASFNGSLWTGVASGTIFTSPVVTSLASVADMLNDRWTVEVGKKRQIDSKRHFDLLCLSYSISPQHRSLRQTWSLRRARDQARSMFDWRVLHVNSGTLLPETFCGRTDANSVFDRIIQGKVQMALRDCATSRQR